MEVSDDIDVDLDNLTADMDEDYVVEEEEENQQEGSETSDESSTAVTVVENGNQVNSQSSSDSESDLQVNRVSARKDMKVKPFIGRKPNGKTEVIANGPTGDRILDGVLFGMGADSTIVIPDEPETKVDGEGKSKQNGKHSSKSKDKKKKEKKEKKEKSKKSKEKDNKKITSKEKSSATKKKQQDEEEPKPQNRGGRKRKVEDTTPKEEDQHLRYNTLMPVSQRPKFKKRAKDSSITKEVVKNKAWQLTKKICEVQSKKIKQSEKPDLHDAFNFMELVKDCNTDDERNRVITNSVFDFLSWSEVIPQKIFNKVFAMPYNMECDPADSKNFTEAQSFTNFAKLTYTLMAYDKVSELEHHRKEIKSDPEQENELDLSKCIV